MKLIYMGSPAFSVYGLDALTASAHEVVAVVSRVDKAKGRKKELTPTELKKRALELGLPVYTPKDVNDPEFLAFLKTLGADVIVVSAFGRILKTALLSLPPRGVLNIHGSLLPRYRGASPMNAALRDGAKETGITVMYVSEGMDEGDIMLTEALPIGENENFSSLMPRMGELGGKLIVDGLDLLARGEAPRIPQDDQGVTYCQLLTREDERIHWDQEGGTIHNQVRSLSLEPGAYTYFENEPFKILETAFEKGGQGGTPGKIMGFDKKRGVAVAVKSGTLWLKTVKPQGKKNMAANDWYRGLREKENLSFETEQV